MYGRGPRFVVLYGSNGTGKTIVLFQCFLMQISNFKLRDKAYQAMVLVATDSIKDPICGKTSLKHGWKHCGTPNCDGPELLYDLKTKYLGSLSHCNDITVTTLEKACQGTYKNYC